jgi:hypothetical protein
MSTPAPRTYFDTQVMEPRLRSLFGIGVEDLQSVGAAALRAFVGVSALHPKGFNGTSAWAEATSQIRALLIPHGWVPRDPQNQPRIVSGDDQLAITVSSGTPDSGVPHGNPQTRNDKGAQTAGSVNFNARQLALFPVTEAEGYVRTPRTAAGNQLWILLYFIDFDAHEVRLELSQPTAMSDADKVSGWSTRFILPPLKFGPEWDDRVRDEGLDVDFDIMPKQL